MYANSEEAESPRMVQILVTPDGDLWEMRCGHCGKIERYASEKEALDAAQDHSRVLGLNEEPRLRVDGASGGSGAAGEPPKLDA